MILPNLKLLLNCAPGALVPSPPNEEAPVNGLVLLDAPFLICSNSWTNAARLGRPYWFKHPPAAGILSATPRGLLKLSDLLSLLWFLLLFAIDEERPVALS